MDEVQATNSVGYSAAETSFADAPVYFESGTYTYPLAEPGEAKLTNYLGDFSYMPWFRPRGNVATFVVSPMGVVNYTSDLQSHMAIPNANNLTSGLIYDILDSNQFESDQKQMSNVQTSLQHIENNSLPNNSIPIHEGITKEIESNDEGISMDMDKGNVDVKKQQKAAESIKEYKTEYFSDEDYFDKDANNSEFEESCS